MSATALWVTIGSIVGLLAVSIILFYTGGWEAIREMFAWFRHSFSTFIDVCPKPLKVFLFLFFLLWMGNFIVGTWLNFNYACLTDGSLRVPEMGIVGGVGMNLEGIFEKYEFENATPTQNASYNTFIIDHTVPAKVYEEDTAEGLVSVQCIGNNPRLTLKGLDILDFRMWVMLTLITGILSITISLRKI